MAGLAREMFQNPSVIIQVPPEPVKHLADNLEDFSRNPSKSFRNRFE
jgi:hypothetical protein